MTQNVFESFSTVFHMKKVKIYGVLVLYFDLESHMFASANKGHKLILYVP